MIVAAIGMNEFYIMAGKTGANPSIIFSILFGLHLHHDLVDYFTTGHLNASVSLIGLSPFVLFIIELYKKSSTPFLNLAWSFLGIIYIAVPLSFISYIAFYEGVYYPQILMGIFFILWASDTGAYMAGKQFGKHKLFESISPKKTWEGTIGGGILALGMAYGNFRWFGIFSILQWWMIGITIVVFGNFGDLAESMLKRSVGVKDSGTILPGHGGILDRFDSLLLSLPFLASLMYMIRH